MLLAPKQRITQRTKEYSGLKFQVATTEPYYINRLHRAIALFVWQKIELPIRVFLAKSRAKFYSDQG